MTTNSDQFYSPLGNMLEISLRFPRTQAILYYNNFLCVIFIFIFIMGCDGGSIPKREDLVQVAKKPEKVDQTEAERTKWFYCALSKQVLRPPVVTCNLGYLYNKEIVLKHLLEKTIPPQFAHIKSLKVHSTYIFRC
jgi:hypothetical protein